MRKAMLFLVVLSACAAQPSPTGGSTPPGSTDPGGGSNGNPDPGGGSNGNPDPGGSMTATQYLAAMDMKFCDEAFTCQSSFPTDTGDTFADEFGASASECYADGEAYDMPAQVEAEIAAGKIHYDAAAAQACVSGLMFGSCTDFWAGTGGTYPTECDTALVGTVADGGACVVDYDCSNVESYCDPTAHTCTADTGQ